MSDPKRSSLAKHATMQLVAGGSAGCIEVCLMHPLDLVKTRFQIQTSPATTTTAMNTPNQQYYNGVVDCMRKMYRSEGILSFWKGVLPPILVESPKRAWKFFTFEQFRRILVFSPNQHQALTYSMAGLVSGVTEAVIVNPFEVIKVKMQANRAHQKAAPTTGQVVKAIIREEGVFRHGLLGKGITGTMCRNGTFNCIYFGFYHTCKELLPNLSDPKMEVARKFAIGLAAGTIASCANIPFDVAKSRIQGPQPVPGRVVYRGVFKTIGVVYANEGFRALYKGLVPKILRLGPGGAIMFLVYEYVYAFLQKKYPD